MDEDQQNEEPNALFRCCGNLDGDVNFYGKFNRGHIACLLYAGSLNSGESVIGGSTVVGAKASTNSYKFQSHTASKAAL